jgi:hypothetical protein
MGSAGYVRVDYQHYPRHRDESESDSDIFEDDVPVLLPPPWATPFGPPQGGRGRCAAAKRARERLGDRVALTAAWMSVAAVLYWTAVLVPGMAAYALTTQLADRPWEGVPYTAKALLSVARAAGFPAGFALVLVGRVRALVTRGWRRRALALLLIGPAYGLLPNGAFALDEHVAIRMAGQFAGSLVVSSAFCAYLACAQGRRASDAIMPAATAAILLAPAASRPLAMAVLDGLVGGRERWMPLAVSVLCLPAALVATVMLLAAPPPTAADAEARVSRASPTRAGDRAWLRRHAVALVGLAGAGAALQAVGGLRDVFTADLLGAGAPWWQSLVADAPACVVACLACAGLAWVDDNRRAFGVVGAAGFVAGLGVAAAGALALAGTLAPLPFLVASGAGQFLALVPFSGGGVVYERLIGASGMGVDGVLVNALCQAPGYVGALAALLVAPVVADPAGFFAWAALVGGFALACAWGLALLGAWFVLPTRPPTGGSSVILIPPI